MRSQRVEVTMRYLGCVLVLVAVTGCAGVTFHSSASPKDDAGLEFFPPKPYLLVVNTGSKDKPTEVSVLYLPDLRAPRVAKIKRGWGSHTMSLALTNGMLTSFGQTADSKIPETLTALGSLATGLGAGMKSRAEARELREEGLELGERLEMAARLEPVAADLSARAMDPQVGWTANQKTDAQAAASKLSNVALALRKPEEPDFKVVIDTLGATAEILGRLELSNVGLSLAGQETNNALANHKTTVAEVLKSLTGAVVQKPPAFILYEIVLENGKTRLVPADL